MDGDMPYAREGVSDKADCSVGASSREDGQSCNQLLLGSCEILLQWDWQYLGNSSATTTRIGNIYVGFLCCG